MTCTGSLMLEGFPSTKGSIGGRLCKSAVLQAISHVGLPCRSHQAGQAAVVERLQDSRPSTMTFGSDFSPIGGNEHEIDAQPRRELGFSRLTVNGAHSQGVPER